MSSSQNAFTSPADGFRTRTILVCRGHDHEKTGFKGWAKVLPLLLLWMLLGSSQAFAADALEDVACPTNLNSCSAGDITTTVVASSAVGGDTCADGFLDVEWTFEFETTANQRYDLGVFVSLDGGTIQQPTTAIECAGAAPEPGDGDPPTFFENNDMDMCGDLSTTGGPVQWTVFETVACTDFNDQGQLFVNSCRVWQQNAQTECNDLAAAGTGSKCDCTPLTLEVDPCDLVTCNDSNVCNGTETCNSDSGVAVCEQGTPLVCDDGNVCDGTETCDPTNGCQAGTPLVCDDGNVCDGTETCDPTNGCQDGTPLICDDGNVCDGTETCDPTNGCQDGTPLMCDDGNVCDGTETCDPTNGCQDGTPLICDDGNVCDGTETCDPTNGCQDGTPLVCSNGDVCDGDETCDPINGCQDGTPLVCSNGDVCDGDEICDPDAGCQPGTPLVCDNGEFCDGDETCDPVEGCQAGTPVDPDDGVVCTDDICDETNDKIVNTPIDANCSNGDVCDGDEICDPTNGCQPGTPLICSNGDVCDGDETCDPINGCQPGTPLVCNNGQFCDGTETCDSAAGCQLGTPVDCSSLDDQCNLGVCDEGEDGCVADPKPDSTPCEDGDACSSEDGTPQDPDHCISGTCTGIAVDCNDGGSCNGEETCNATTGACEPDPQGFVCEEICQSNGNAKPKPPKGLEWQYVNTSGDSDFDSVCIYVEHPQGPLEETSPYQLEDGEFFTTTRAGGNNRKLNPQLTFEICARDGNTCTDNCDASFIVHTSCSLPLGIGQHFPDLNTHDVVVSGQIP